ncbi:MAG: ATP synthase F1 subunit delta [Bacteroidales bacterium]|nr:ATP synthase F1 subunit delta [Bacteroidales bacterium]
MNEGKISVRYAKALFLTAEERNLIDTVREDMEYILDLASMGNVKEMLDSPVITSDIKHKALEELTRSRVNDLSFSFVKLVLENNREMFLPGIARCYMDQADKYRGVTRAKFTTALPASEKTMEILRNYLEKESDGEVIISLISDPSLTGGFLLNIGDSYIDGSVRTQLRKIKQELTGE